MAKRRGGAVAVCPQHPGSHVVCAERRETKSGPRFVFRCQPADGSPKHKFTVVVAGDVPVAVWSPPPVCPKHPDSHVVRNGTYAITTAKPRQRYRCFPDPSDRTTFHGFTPWLPRHHVHVGAESCEECEEIRGTHRGDQSVSNASRGRHASWAKRSETWPEAPPTRRCRFELVR